MIEKYPANLRIGCAGWSIPKADAERFPSEGSHLERYAQRFSAVEINSSFYRPHLPATYARWAASVPTAFQFAVKAPREITHKRRLVDAVEILDRFLADTGALGSKLGPLLLQLPPSLAFRERVAGSFFGLLRERFAGPVACEPRHASWFVPSAEALLRSFRLARVAADPAVVPSAGEPGGGEDLLYFRLHGTPRMYYSPYATEYLERLADRLGLEGRARSTWCIFDNTAVGSATSNALTILQVLASRGA